MVSVKKKVINIADNNSYRYRKSATRAICAGKQIPYICDGINNNILIHLHKTAFRFEFLIAGRYHRMAFTIVSASIWFVLDEQ